MTDSVKIPFLDGLKDTLDHRPEDIAHLRQWLTGEPHLPALSDDHLHLFLHSNYCKLEKTKHTIECYFTIRTNATDVFANWDPMAPAIQKMLNTATLVRTPRRTPEGYTVLMYRLTECEANKFDFITAVKLFSMFNDMILSEDGLSPGYIVIFDMKGITLGHLSTVTISGIKIFMSYIQDAHPARLKGVHVVNSVSFIDKILMLVKPFIKGELMSMLHFHGAPGETLAKILPLDCLPGDYEGGKGDDTMKLHAQYRKMLETKYVEYFRLLNAMRVDDSKREGKSKSDGKMFGAVGSFRSLSID